MSSVRELVHQLRRQADNAEKIADGLVWRGRADQSWRFYNNADEMRAFAAQLVEAIDADESVIRP